ncbi:small membrane protein [Klebsiella quasipneumoniae]|nr:MULTISPECIES: small membrane protein [Klebsiella]HBR1015612.1 small membrane protein [Klebsiella quasipneumoniae subsp. similipneumoniae]HBR1557915.1 small membrane protein [Klebsiella quasipneumoniae subsp. quasipneumoniae]MCQ0900480.1 small membrane protein [Klebsiella pneumoniae]MEB6597522.1 small membrane protein [Klebsiella quasipneumoniae]HBR1235613.1 small membrane protein [Klebsiella pneumoniae]
MGSFILFIIAVVLLGCSIYSMFSYFKDRTSQRRAFKKRR